MGLVNPGQTMSGHVQTSNADAAAAVPAKCTVPSELLTELRKARYRDARQAPLILRPLLALEVWITYALLRTGVAARCVTFLWFACGLTGYVFLAWGRPWSFVVGALLVHLKIILDLSDGQIGRYRKRFMSDVEDITTHMQGIYLDRVQHAIESPLWGIALGWGAYRLTGNAWMVLCGASIAAMRTFVRFDRLLKSIITLRFQDRVAELSKSSVSVPRQDRRRRQSAVRRLFERAFLWIRNGKRFNSLILACGLADWLLLETYAQTPGMPALLVLAGLLSPIFLCARIGEVQFTDQLLKQALTDEHHFNSNSQETQRDAVTEGLGDLRG